MSLSDKEKEIWEQLENELLAEKPIRKATADMKKEQSRGPRHLVIGVGLILVGLIGMVVSVLNVFLVGGLASFLVMLYGGNFAYDALTNMGKNYSPKNSGFDQALANLKNYKPRNDFL
jgi:hypothetical protein